MEKFSDLRTQGKTFVSYLDEHSNIVSGYMDVISVSEGMVRIASNTNIIIFPLHRLLKMKQSREDSHHG